MDDARTENDTSSENLFDLDKVELNVDEVLFEEEGDFFAFTTKTQEEGRKIGYLIGESILKQRTGGNFKEDRNNSILSGLKRPGLIDDYRLDGGQLSFSEDHDDEGNWKAQVYLRYPNATVSERLHQAVGELGFFNT